MMTLETQIKFILPMVVVFMSSFFLWFGKISGDAWVLLAGGIVGAPLSVEGWKSYQLRKLQESAMLNKVPPPVPLDVK
jgi:hypothetical protein